MPLLKFKDINGADLMRFIWLAYAFFAIFAKLSLILIAVGLINTTIWSATCWLNSQRKLDK